MAPSPTDSHSHDNDASQSHANGAKAHATANNIDFPLKADMEVLFATIATKMVG